VKDHIIIELLKQIDVLNTEKKELKELVRILIALLNNQEQ
jgi:hypothetical protein